MKSTSLCMCQAPQQSPTPVPRPFLHSSATNEHNILAVHHGPRYKATFVFGGVLESRSHVGRQGSGVTRPGPTTAGGSATSELALEFQSGVGREWCGVWRVKSGVNSGHVMRSDPSSPEQGGGGGQEPLHHPPPDRMGYGTSFPKIWKKRGSSHNFRVFWVCELWGMQITSIHPEYKWEVNYAWLMAIGWGMEHHFLRYGKNTEVHTTSVFFGWNHLWGMQITSIDPEYKWEVNFTWLMEIGWGMEHHFPRSGKNTDIHTTSAFSWVCELWGMQITSVDPEFKWEVNYTWLMEIGCVWNIISQDLEKTRKFTQLPHFLDPEYKWEVNYTWLMEIGWGVEHHFPRSGKNTEVHTTSAFFGWNHLWGMQITSIDPEYKWEVNFTWLMEIGWGMEHHFSRSGKNTDVHTTSGFFGFVNFGGCKSLP
ncbi:hypothetical protein EDB85DRAFT_2277037 [Lactarius pseudohatsudake]|nr:hypothetical protein EDB85DRAFT_2277037 [Lactarius pseudohatsudake]